MGKKLPRIFPRNCFVCDQPMIVDREISMLFLVPSVWMECKTCDIIEDATVNGFFPEYYDELEWDGELLPLIDHSKVYLPSPDNVGSQAEPLMMQPVKPCTQ